MTGNTVPKQTVDKNGKKTTVYVSVDRQGNLNMRRLDGLRKGAPTSFTPDPKPSELTNGTFDPKPWITPQGVRVKSVPIASAAPEGFIFAPQEAFGISKEPIDSAATVSYANPYIKDKIEHRPFLDATASSIDNAVEYTAIRIGAGKTYKKGESGEWIHSDPVGGIDRVPSFWFKRKLEEGLDVQIAPPQDYYDLVNEFEFDGLDIKHYYIDPSTVRIEAETSFGAEVAYWSTDGTNDILRERKGTLADVTVALARFANGEPINTDLD